MSLVNESLTRNRRFLELKPLQKNRKRDSDLTLSEFFRTACEAQYLLMMVAHAVGLDRVQLARALMMCGGVGVESEFSF